ncbi:hypothetical protein AHAS_Ahas07G0158200 [Arachis hypogaea]
MWPTSTATATGSTTAFSDGWPSEGSVSGTDAVAGERIVGDGLVDDDLEEVDIDFAPDWDPSEFVIVDDPEEKLKEACAKASVGPPNFFPQSPAHMGGKVHHGYEVHVFSNPSEVNFAAFGGYLTDEYVARQHAAFVAMEVLLIETETKVWDFNFQVAQRYKARVDELQREAMLCLPERLFQMEEEILFLKDRLRDDKAWYESAKKLGPASSIGV